jgi:2-phosphoglycerate kinase
MDDEKWQQDDVLSYRIIRVSDKHIKVWKNKDEQGEVVLFFREWSAGYLVGERYCMYLSHIRRIHDYMMAKYKELGKERHKLIEQSYTHQ